MYGPHVSREAFDNAEIGDVHCCQFYLNGNLMKQNPWRPLEHWDYPEDFHYYIHAPVNLNLAKSSNTGHLKVLKKILNEVEDTPGTVVIHIGTLGTVEMVAERLNSLKIPNSLSSKTLVLENSAGQGNHVGKNFKELRKLFEALDDKSKIGLCIDTQHSFGSGLCDFSTKKVINKFFDKLDDIAEIPVLHLNDSKVDFESHKDSHEVLGKGKIWGESTDTLKYLLKISAERELDLICETTKFERSRKLVKKLGGLT